MDCSVLKTAVELIGFSAGVYLVANKDSDPGLVNKVRKAFDAKVADGTLATMFDEAMSDVECMNMED